MSDVNSAMLARYLEWLNRQVGPDGTPWHLTTRGAAYSGVRTLLRWLQRCRPGLLGTIDFPRNVFPLRHTAKKRSGLSPQVLRAILKACEQEIAALRTLREQGAQELAAARAARSGEIRTRGEVLLYIEEHHGGVAPPALTLVGKRNCVRTASDAHGGYCAIKPCLYPRIESIFPYYLAILIHAAGNPQAIAQLGVDCLRPIPLLDDRELLVWSKGRAGKLQRRSFRTTDPFEPPALVREIVQWTQRLRRARHQLTAIDFLSLKATWVSAHWVGHSSRPRGGFSSPVTTCHHFRYQRYVRECLRPFSDYREICDRRRRSRTTRTCPPR